MRKFVAQGKNESFDCINCGQEIKPLANGSIRNHCPYCLYSIHIDINPGDRACKCLARLEPIAVDYNAKKGWIIIHKCVKCGEIKRNKAALDDSVQADNYELIIELSTKSNY